MNMSTARKCEVRRMVIRARAKDASGAQGVRLVKRV